MTVSAPQGGIPFVDQDRTLSNSAIIFLQQLHNAVTGSGSGGSGGFSNFPLLAPNGTVSAPNYSWSAEPITGFYRAAFNDIRYSVNGVDVAKFNSAVLDVGGLNVVIGDATTFYFPTTASLAAAHGVTLKANRLQVGTEALFGTQFNRSPQSWVSTYLNGDANTFASIACTSQIGGYPVVGATRTSDFRTVFGSASQGSGTYFLALNDDTTGAPIAAGCNPTAWRASGVGGVTEACQVDVENAGSVVDIDSHLGFQNGTTIGLNVTCGAFNASSNASSAAVTFDHTGTGKFRKGIVVTNGTLDTGVGAGGGGIFANLPTAASIQWISPISGSTLAELWGNSFGVITNTPVFSAEYGIAGGFGFGGTVSQITSITTAVTLNKICGQITTVSNAFTSGTSTAFVLNNTTIASSDVVLLTTGTNNILATAFNVGTNVVSINLQAFANTTTTVVINFMVLKVSTT